VYWAIQKALQKKIEGNIPGKGAHCEWLSSSKRRIILKHYRETGRGGENCVEIINDRLQWAALWNTMTGLPVKIKLRECLGRINIISYLTKTVRVNYNQHSTTKHVMRKAYI
jgi:hypothetical protein